MKQKVTLISLNPPIVREVNPYAKEPCQEQIDMLGKDKAIQDQSFCHDITESYLQQWLLSESSWNDLLSGRGTITKCFEDWIIGQQFEVSINEKGEAVIVN